MAERLELGQPRYNEFNMGLAEDTLFNADTGSVYGSLQKGDESNPYMMGADQLLQQGSQQYGLTGWEDLWGSGGELLRPDALLRSMNATSAFGMAPMTASQAQRQYGGYASPNQLGQRGLAAGYQGAQNYATQQGMDPNLVRWLSGINDFNAKLNDPRERFFDPNTLSFGVGDFGGMDLGGATQESLNAWAQQNYGTDLLGLATMGAPLAQTRYDLMQDPTQFWDRNTGSFNVLSLPGMEDEAAAARMSAYQTAYANMQGEAQQQRDQGYSEQFNQALMSNPELMRTSYGQYLGGSGAMAQQLQGMAGQRVAPPTDYSLLYGYGISPDLANQNLAHLGLQGGLY